MKNRVLIIALTIFVLSVSSCNNKDDIVSQNNMIVADQMEFYRLNDALFELFESDAGEENCVLIYDSLTLFLKMNILKYDTIPPSDNDRTLILAMQNFLKDYQHLAYHEYKELLHIVIKPRYLFESADLRELDSLYSLVDLKQDRIDDDFSKIQDAFLQKHHIEVSKE
jgi:uncharacterized membrane protein YciS (DUF1049 family)